MKDARPAKGKLTRVERKRLKEKAKYQVAYSRKRYRMKKARMADAVHDIGNLPVRGGLLDVSCGRGEMMANARELGYSPVKGTEIIERLLGPDVVFSWAHKLPFKDGEFNVVTMWDVIEHLMPGDDEACVKEMIRVAKHHVVLTANNKPSVNKKGQDLHINKRPYEEWETLLTLWAAPHKVMWIKGERNYISEAYRIDKVL